MLFNIILLGLFAFCFFQSVQTNKRWEEAAHRAMMATEEVRKQRDRVIADMRRIIEADKSYFITHPNKEIRDIAHSILRK